MTQNSGAGHPNLQGVPLQPPPPPPAAAPAVTPPQTGPHILGIGTAGLAGLSVDELVNNKVAITMVMHYYKQLVDENTSLKNDINTANTYVAGYERKETNTRVGTWLQFLGTIGIGFAINLLTNDAAKLHPWVILVIGVAVQGVGIHFSLKDGEK